MDETKAIIRRGCSLAQDLEENLGNISKQPELLTRYCDEIIRVFSQVKDRNVILDQSGEQLVASSGGVQECVQSEFLIGSRGVVQPEPRTGGEMKEMEKQEMVGGGSSSSSQRQRRRRDEGEKKTVRVAAPRTEIAPEDGYTWRKYGQKEILNSKFPRSYFRCTHQKLYKCPAKKQVQRVDNDPNMLDVTYRGDHTCHLSSTAPSHLPPPPLQLTHDLISPAAAAAPLLHPPSSGQLSHWLSMDINIRPPPPPPLGVADGMQIMYKDFTSNSGAGAAAGSSTSAATARLGDYQIPVADMADVMFNSGSSSNNSMDAIFSSIDDHKWDSGENK